MWSTRYIVSWTRNLILVLLARAFIPQENSGATKDEAAEDKKWYWDNVGLALRGYTPSEFFEAVGWRPRLIIFHTCDGKETYVVKRLTNKNEVKMLKLLTSDDFNDPGNPTAFPLGLYNFERLYISPQLYTYLAINWTTRRALDFTHQLFQGLAFYHERRVAHLDIVISNVIFATPTPGRIKVLFIDFEFSGFFPNQACPRVTLPKIENGPVPPEGHIDVDPFPYDVFRAGRLVKSIMIRHRQANTVEWPAFLVALLKEIASVDPTARPTMQTRLARFNDYIKEQGEKYMLRSLRFPLRKSDIMHFETTSTMTPSSSNGEEGNQK